jgi:hypothetical protein
MVVHIQMVCDNHAVCEGRVPTFFRTFNPATGGSISLTNTDTWQPTIITVNIRSEVK